MRSVRSLLCPPFATPEKIKKDIVALTVLTILAGLAGIFWGFDILYKGPFTYLHIDEYLFSRDITRFVNNNIFSRTDYFYGLPAQIEPFLCLIKFFKKEVLQQQALFAGRFLSLLSAVADVWLLYFFALNCLKNRQAALWAGLFLALAPLHAAMSHVSTPAMNGTFWLYASLVSAYSYTRSENPKLIVLTGFASGAAIAVKFGLVSLIPLIYCVFHFFKKSGFVWSAFLAMTASFILFNAGYVPWHQTLLLRKLVYDNYALRQHDIFLNPFLYFFGLLPGLGLFTMVLAAAGAGRLARTGFYDVAGNQSVRDRFFCLEIPLAAQFAGICFMSNNFIRHVLFLLPYLALLAGAGAVWLYEEASKRYSKKTGVLLLSLIVFYQAVSVGWMESRYLFDRFFAARHWLSTEKKADESVWTSDRLTLGMIQDNFFPRAWVAQSADDAEYFVLLETAKLIVTRSFLNPLEDEPGRDRWYYWRDSKDPQFIRSVIKGKTDFKPHVTFSLPEIIPEFFLYRKYLGIFSPSIPGPGDVIIYKRMNR